MSDKSLARRSHAQITFAGVDITKAMQKYLLSVTYTDSEENEADDLQIKLQDREGLWLENWLGDMIDAASQEHSTGDFETTVYKVTANSGLNVRTGPGTNHSILGVLAYGTSVDVAEISGSWAKISYSGQTAYVSVNYLVKISQGSSGEGDWKIGDAVSATGRPMYTSYGTRPGNAVTNYQGSITYLNLQSGVPYPIHVGQLGWFAESQVTKTGTESAEQVTQSKGLKIQAVIATSNWNSDGKDSVLDCGQFELDSIDASGPPDTVTIKATALPFTSTVRQTKKTKAWEAYHLSGIANEIAQKNGMSCLYLAAEDPWYDRAEQYCTPDIQFLSQRCKAAGISLKATNNSLVLFDQAEYEGKSEVQIIRKGDGTYTKHKVKTSSADTKYASCRVSWTDEQGRKIEGIARVEDYKADDETNQQLDIRAKVSSIAEAEKLAAKMLRMHNLYQKTASFTLPGSPLLIAGSTVMLEDWGAWSGKYIISKAKHTVSASGYTTQIDLRKTLEGY